MGEDKPLDAILEVLEVASSIREMDRITERISDEDRLEIIKQLTQLMDTHRDAIWGTPEWDYVQSLHMSYLNPTDRHAALDVTLSDTVLPVRVRTALQKAGMTYLWELVGNSEQDLLDLKNFGNTALNCVKSYLNEQGLRLGMTVPYSRPEENRHAG
jgi:DNA-directed RNA polymerase alpha subunit